MMALLRRDLRIGLRAGGGFGQGLGFYLILAMLVPFGVGPDTQLLGAIAPGILWIGALLACLLSLDRIFALDYEDGSLDHLAIAPIPLEWVVLIKAVAHWILSALPLIVAAPLIGVLLGLPSGANTALIAALIVGSPALSMIGTFGAALVVGVKRGGLLLSLVVLPLYIPTLIFGAQVVNRAATGQAFGPLLGLLGAVSLLSLAILPFAAAGALRVNLR